MAQRITLVDIQKSIDGLSIQVGQLNKYIIGNGNPEQGLLFKVAQNRAVIESISNNCAMIQAEKKKTEIDRMQTEVIVKLMTQEQKNDKIAKALPGTNGKILGMDKKLFLTLIDKLLSWGWKALLILALGEQAVDIATKF